MEYFLLFFVYCVVDKCNIQAQLGNKEEDIQNLQ